MQPVFAPPVTELPEADIPLPGCTAYLSLAADHQILFMTFTQDIDLPAHVHAAQSGFVLAGKIDLIIDGVKQTYVKSDSYTIPKGVEHAGKIYAGYADISVFQQKDRYQLKVNEN